jgi:hypothetical protein
MTKITAINIKVGRGTAVHYAWATNGNGEKVNKIRAFCGASGAGGGMRGYDLGVSGITESPATCPKCIKAMERAQEFFKKESNETV